MPPLDVVSGGPNDFDTLSKQEMPDASHLLSASVGVMLRRRQTRVANQILAQQTRRHRKLLKPGEVFLAACDAFGGDESHPPPLSSGWRRGQLTIDATDEALRLEAAARDRLARVAGVLGIGGFSEMPYSPTGYLLTHTDRRMLIFNGTGKQYLLQSPILGVWLQPFDHGDGSYTLVLTSVDDRVAFCTRRDSTALTESFIASFPDRRHATRRVLANSSPQDIAF